MGRPSSFNEIYGLFDPRSGELRYIGKAANAERRLKSHKRDAKRRTTPVYVWMRDLAQAGMSPALKVLETTGADWQSVERRLIAKHLEAGADLLNLAPGGNEPSCSTAVRAENGRKVAASRDKVIWRIKRDLGDFLKRGYLSEHTKEKMRQAARAKPAMFGDWAGI
jgi:hypothetical protein